MHENLEKYLKEISHYLAVKHGANEIIAEIRSHILEKAERESGSVTAESLDRTIAGYGRPRDVAAKYMDGDEIISPTFRKYLFRYTAMLFAVHFVLTVLAVSFGTSIIAIPFFFIPKMSAFWAIPYLFMALVYDFGVVALILYLVTQRKGDVRLPWFGVRLANRGESGLKKPRPAVLAMLVAFFGVLLYLFLRYHTLFFYTINFSRPESLLNPAASVFFSILFLAAFACDIIGYWIRFLFNTAWITLAQHAVVLLILWIVWNSPVKPEYRSVPGVDLSLVGGGFVLFLTVLTVFGFLRSLVRVAREMSLP
ncbi:MAG: hypothetical protein NTW97_04430 [Candidatus Krumholzibacteria bacterium]|nr:hypothetical protein [Candidatus Krumholzibacteria bacterium]